MGYHHNTKSLIKSKNKYILNIYGTKVKEFNSFWKLIKQKIRIKRGRYVWREK